MHGLIIAIQNMNMMREAIDANGRLRNVQSNKMGR